MLAMRSTRRVRRTRRVQTRPPTIVAPASLQPPAAATYAMTSPAVHHMSYASSYPVMPPPAPHTVYERMAHAEAPTNAAPPRVRVWDHFPESLLHGATTTDETATATDKTTTTTTSTTTTTTTDESAPAAPHRLVLGVDGGGTKTVACLLDSVTREVRGLGVAGCSNQNSVGDARAAEATRVAIANAVASAAAKLGADDERGAARVTASIVRACLSMSGVDRPADAERVRQWLASALPALAAAPSPQKTTDAGGGDDEDDDANDVAARVLVYNDAAAALAGGTNGVLDGVVIISGTGTICVGFSNRRQAARVSGWGPLLGDAGSGYDIGLQVLAAVTAAADRRTPPTALTQLVLRATGATGVQSLIDWAYADARDWDRFASLSRLAFAAAADGDRAALRILHAAAKSLFDTLVTLVSAHMFVGVAPADVAFDLVLQGGILTHFGSLVTAELSRLVHMRYPRVTVNVNRSLAAAGAALLCLT